MTDERQEEELEEELDHDNCADHPCESCIDRMASSVADWWEGQE